MNKAKTYDGVLFSADAIAEAYTAFQKLNKGKLDLLSASVQRGPEEWGFDNLDEFLAEIRLGFHHTYLTVSGDNSDRSLHVDHWNQGRTQYSKVDIRAPIRGDIQRIYEVFERHVEPDTIHVEPPPMPVPKIFIGHGQDSQWRDLRDHLHDKHGYEIEAYEIGEQAGLNIQSILGTKLNRSTMALLVLTAEDPGAHGTTSRARQNVVHELGLFQGRIGFPKAIAILEDGTEDFSNLQGTHQIRFERGHIASTFGDVLATIKREFSKADDAEDDDY